MHIDIYKNMVFMFELDRKFKYHFDLERSEGILINIKMMCAKGTYVISPAEYTSYILLLPAAPPPQLNALEISVLLGNLHMCESQSLDKVQTQFFGTSTGGHV